MRVFRSLLAALVYFAAGPAIAQQIEGVPNFKECKDDSLDRAMKDGVTLGISPSPPYSSLEPTSKKAEGLGLGLAISRTIVEAHGGTLWLADTDAGAAFCITLPATK